METILIWTVDKDQIWKVLPAVGPLTWGVEDEANILEPAKSWINSFSGGGASHHLNRKGQEDMHITSKIL